jgi:hypothetical protein
MLLPKSTKQLVAGLLMCSIVASYVPPAFAQETAAGGSPAVTDVVETPVTLPEAPQETATTPPVADPVIDPIPEITPDPVVVEEPDVSLPEPSLEEPATAAKPQEEKKPEPEESQVSMLSGPAPAFNDVQDVRKVALPRVEQNSGALVYDYAFKIPPGRNGFQPDLRLTYNSQNMRDGDAFGSNWTLSVPSIERLNKRGSEILYSTTTATYFTSSLDGELATSTAATSTYVALVEHGNFHSYVFANDQWVMTDKQGTRYTFGASAASRQDDPNDATRIFGWMLEEVRDTNDNVIRYTYTKDAGQIYMETVRYTGSGSTDGIFEVAFAYEGRPDVTHAYKSGFTITTQKRATRVDVKVNGTVTGSFALTYATHGRFLRPSPNQAPTSLAQPLLCRQPRLRINRKRQDGCWTLRIIFPSLFILMEMTLDGSLLTSTLMVSLTWSKTVSPPSVKPVRDGLMMTGIRIHRFLRSQISTAMPKQTCSWPIAQFLREAGWRISTPVRVGRQVISGSRQRLFQTTASELRIN